MFNLLVRAIGWEGRQGTIPNGRMLTWTEDEISARFSRNNSPDLETLTKLPALFVQETNHRGTQQFARVGTITRATLRAQEVQIEYSFDPDIPPIPQSQLIEIAEQLDINMRPRGLKELDTTHWAVKDVDLFKVLLTNLRPVRRAPTAFQLPEPAFVDPGQVSAMMPFSAPFTEVYNAIRSAVEAVGLRCDRVDGIWENHSVIQDVISLIDRSSFVICDCTDRNPNVFYEIGIAHTLGKEVILITQNGNDIPFDLKHIRYLTYLNNGEGLAVLQRNLTDRLRNPIIR